MSAFLAAAFAAAPNAPLLGGDTIRFQIGLILDPARRGNGVSDGAGPEKAIQPGSQPSTF